MNGLDRDEMDRIGMKWVRQDGSGWVETDGMNWDGRTGLNWIGLHFGSNLIDGLGRVGLDRI